MSRYEELVPSYIEQKARGLKPRGRCAEPGCGRELALRADNTVSPHKRIDRQGYSTGADCLGGGERSMNLTLDRVRPDLDTIEARMLVRIVGLAMNNGALSLILDVDKSAVLERALAKLNDPASRTTLTRTEEAQMFARLAAEEHPHDADHEPVWVTATDGDNEPARDADGNTWSHCGICGAVREGAPGRPASEPVVPLATPCARPGCEHTLNWHTGTPGGVCVARGGVCPCAAFIPPGR